MPSGSNAMTWSVFNKGWSLGQGEVIGEAVITIAVNGDELVSLMATPSQQSELAIGFLLSENLIKSFGEIDHIHVSDDGCCVDVWLQHAVALPTRRVITSGCGGGVTFEEPGQALERVESDLRILPDQLFDMFRRLHIPDSLHARARGVHAAGITDGEQILALAEDVGRHNTIDKVLGVCLKEEIQTQGKALLATGRISSEMLRKGARMGCPIIASRNSPTSLSVNLAEAAGITLVGYARQGNLRAYSHPYRLGLEDN
jgi:FdhD protein